MNIILEVIVLIIAVAALINLFSAIIMVFMMVKADGNSTTKQDWVRENNRNRRH